LAFSLLFITWYFIVWPITLQKKLQRMDAAVQKQDQ
jgi:hypothetical protein